MVEYRRHLEVLFEEVPVESFQSLSGQPVTNGIRDRNGIVVPVFFRPCEGLFDVTLCWVISSFSKIKVTKMMR